MQRLYAKKLKMKYILTNYGHRFTQFLTKLNTPKLIEENKAYAILLEINTNLFLKEISNDIKIELLQNGLIQKVEDTFKNNSIKLLYKRNPLENIQWLVFEFTTECNFSCLHCRNGFIQKTTETNIERLKLVADAFIRIGVRRFDFIGGEVSKYGKGWLELAKHIKKYKHKQIHLYTNAWWIEKQNFEAAGTIYKNQNEYLADLKKNGVTHIVISIDGDEQHHNKQRRKRGLFSRIVNNIENIRNAGIKVNISSILDDSIGWKFQKDLQKISRKIYDFPEKNDYKVVLHKLYTDKNNSFSNLIDIGGSVKNRKGKYKISDINVNKIHCKAFYRPAPNLRINANGSMAVCPLFNSANVFGNIRNENIINILNNFQNEFTYKLNAEKKLNNYLKYYDTSVFGDTYDHLCSVRIVLMYIATEIEKNKNKNINEIIKEVARITGFIE